MKEEIAALQKFMDTVIEYCVQYSFSVLGAVVVLIIGFVVASQLAAGIARLMGKKNMDPTITKFTAGFVKILVLMFAIIISLGKFGITITPFIAALGGLAFGASMALQGPLANYGAGLSIILSRPFVVGDTITVQEQSGVVEDIRLACTILNTEDGVKITIPNKHIVGEILHNSKTVRIAETVVGISYSADPEKAIQAVKKAILEIEGVTDNPKPQVGIQQFGESSVDIGMRFWVPTQKYYQLLYAVHMNVYKTLQREGINIPFPQRDLHVITNGKGAEAKVF
ncbi:MAG: mechanosensitive ion channel [Candidatus Omnitrophica bacterium]|nr:mechanosensitive ion channel [Candidatus Omnitrophota bacterium]